jgi:hypothetical protein
MYELIDGTASAEYVAASIVQSGLKNPKGNVFSRFGSDTTPSLPVYYNGRLVNTFIDSIRLDDLFKVFEALSRAEIHIKFKDPIDAE